MTYANGNTATYGYSLNNDLTSLQLSFNESEVTFNYFYNNVHQIVGLNADDSSFLWEPSSSSTVDYVITSGSANKDLNQYSSVGGTDYSYDGNGCLTGGPQSATFDTLSRITQIVSGSTTNNYWVDPLNRQARKSVNGTDTDYLYNGQQLIATYDDSGDLLQRFIPGDALDEYFLYIAGSTSTFLNCDRQGSIIAETNASGTILNKFVYSPFGETSSISASNFGYTGQRYDSEIGLYNYKARYYSPSIGRFLQPDPIGYGGGDLNLYSYVGNDGGNLTDPMGLQAVSGYTAPDATISSTKYSDPSDAQYQTTAYSDPSDYTSGSQPSGTSGDPPDPNSPLAPIGYQQVVKAKANLHLKGTASFYDDSFVGGTTNSGTAIFSQKAYTAAIDQSTAPIGYIKRWTVKNKRTGKVMHLHRITPFMAKVINPNSIDPKTGKPRFVIVEINDTGVWLPSIELLI